MTSYYWLAVHLKTGAVIAELPGLVCEKVARQIGTYTTTEATLPVGVPGTPENWLRATLPGASALVLIDAEREAPVWGGMVTTRRRSGEQSVTLALASAEAYLDRRYVGDVTYSQVGQNRIVADLITRYVAAGSNGGLPIRVAFSEEGRLRDRTYTDASDKTVYSVLGELMGIENGPEWSIEWEWAIPGQVLRPVLTVASRIGTSPAPGLSPAATFEMPGPLRSVELEESFTSADGANDVLAVSTASADVRPQSDHLSAADADRPTFEYRFTPSTSITSLDVLNSHAGATLTDKAGGARALSLSSVVRAAPRVGSDWAAGDDIGYIVGGLDRFGRETVPAFPGGISGTARAVGWVLAFATSNAPETITPTLQL
jgi:hypothetical protein